MEVRKGMYGLTHSGLIEQILLEERSKKYGNHQIKYTPIFWMHTFQAISFSLLFEDFGVKDFGKDNTEYLIKVL